MNAELIYFNIEKEKDLYTGKVHNVMYIYLNNKSILFLERMEISCDPENKSFEVNLKHKGEEYNFCSTKANKKEYTFINKFINKKYYYYNIKIMNTTSLKMLEWNSTLYCLEFFQENIVYKENEVNYEF